MSELTTYPVGAVPPAAGDHRLIRLERAAREAGEQLSLAIEALGEGFVLYDENDRLVVCNQRYREIYAISAPIMVPGSHFEEILRFGLARGQYACGGVSKAQWLAERLATHREPYSSHEQELGDGTWLHVIEQATPQGGRIGLRLDITERKRQEAAAAASKRQLEATLAAIPDLLFEIDAQGRYVDCHVTEPDRLVEPRENLFGRTLEEVLPTHAAAVCRAAIEEALRDGRSTGRQYQLETPRGAEWYELSVTRKPASGPAGGRSDEPHLIALARDVTERKQLEESLAAERDFLEQIMATSLAAVVVIEASGQLVFANKAAERVLGVKASTATDRRFDDPAWRVTAVDGGPFPLEELPFVKVLTTGKPVFDVRHAIEWPDGRRRILSVNAAPLAGSSSTPRRVVCSITDITDQMQAEAALRHKEALLRGLFELCPTGIALTDLETGAFIDVNDAGLQQLGYTREELLELTVLDVTPAEYHPRARHNLAMLAQDGPYAPHEKENIRKDGTRFPVRVSSTAVTDSSGRRLVWSIVEDITERKRLEQSLAGERDFLDQIMATSLSAIVAIDASGQLVFANKAAEHVLGVDAATGRRFNDLAWQATDLDGRPLATNETPFVKVMAEGKPVFDVRYTIDRPDGARRLLSVNAAPLAEAPGVPRRVVCSITDITEQVQAESALRYNEALLRGLFELCPVGIALTDFETGAFIEVNDAVLEPLGYTRDELLALTHFDITPEAYHEFEPDNLERLARDGRYGPLEKENIRKDGSRFPVLLRGIMVADLTGRKLIWSVIEDITERKETEARIIRQAHYDDLTCLPNRRLFQERLELALERARRGRHIGAVAMLDLDHFKTVNDSLGHKAGDAVLREAATRLAAATRATDTVARFGGDEFLLLLDDIRTSADADAIARKIQETLARPFVVEGHTMQLGVSIGICVFDAERNDADEVLRFADMAMYTAKNAGRNQTRFFAKGLEAQGADRRNGRS